MTHDTDELAAWTERTLGTKVELARLPAEASTRRFFRVSTNASTFVAMHSPPDTEDNPRFVRLTGLFRQQGLATPEVHAADLERGFLLLEDLGGRDFAAAYAKGDVDAPLGEAVATLVKLQTVVSDDIPPYTIGRFTDELAIFTEWLLTRFLDLELPEVFVDIQESLIAATQSVPQCTVHRDYHCRNLIWRNDGRVGIVDFQDALIGPACYDIASLLRDCYVEFDEGTVARWRDRFFDLASLDCDRRTFDRAFDLVAMQRQLKAVGIFARLYLQHGRDSHLGDILPVLKRIARLAHDYPETRDLAVWLDAIVLPRASRRIDFTP